MGRTGGVPAGAAMIAPMVKVRIVGNRRRLEPFLDVLGALGVVHLVAVSPDSDAAGELLTPCLGGAQARERRDSALAELRLVEEAAALLAVDLAATPAPGQEDGASLRARLRDDLEGVRALQEERDQVRRELDLAERYAALSRSFGPALRDLQGLRCVRSLGVTLDARYRDELLPLLRSRLAEITGGGYQMLWHPLDAETLGVVLLFPPSCAAAVAELLAGENIHEMRLPRRYEELAFHEGLSAVEALRRELPERVRAIDAELERRRRTYAGFLPRERERLQGMLEETEVVGLLRSTRFLFVAEGFLPAGALAGLRARLEEVFGEEVRVFELPVGPQERREVPVVFSNPPFLRPFQRLLGLLPLPRYGTIDPSPLLALSFPVFFGLILGDAGYGLLVLALAAGVRLRWRASPVARDVAFLLAVVAAASVVFGFVYGEFFGDLGHRLALRPIWRERMHAAAALLVLTVSVGAVHVTLGFLLAVVQNLRGRLASKAAAQGASFLALAALFALLAGLADLLPEGSWAVAAVLLLLAVTVLVCLEGPIAAVEVVTAVGNVLSYSRLMALGVASAALAIVANRLAGAVGNLVLGAVVAVLLHGINLALGLFGPTVHGLRLHFVEFLPRFYQYGGVAYRPFRKGEAR